jgi:hypothetical protein
LDAAGLVTVLGIIPDGINAIIYAVEGDWANVGFSAAAMVPLFGEGATLTKWGLKVTQKSLTSTVSKLGKKGLALELKSMRKGVRELSVEATEKTTKEFAETVAEREEKETIEEATEKTTKSKRSGPDYELCVLLYTQCVNRRKKKTTRCDECFGECIEDEGAWPFKKCPIPKL